ncbi:DNA/RNA non-specific endonuclease [Saccharolobus caldissimus]|uniref:Uncharacterized protein n=1 Tax=Saccharolobus caldissimus TaxID=1702097 RepID=A0AAQ4CWV5_9CREN|nr:DNA/RNA non-specific endonuclease [Saccharolobus caldissimus]BDC00287.1 hypothetical protein SACC_33030 [Saccharolobus caldissimus]
MSNLSDKEDKEKINKITEDNEEWDIQEHEGVNEVKKKEPNLPPPGSPTPSNQISISSDSPPDPSTNKRTELSDYEIKVLEALILANLGSRTLENIEKNHGISFVAGDVIKALSDLVELDVEKVSSIINNLLNKNCISQTGSTIFGFSVNCNLLNVNLGLIDDYLLGRAFLVTDFSKNEEIKRIILHLIKKVNLEFLHHYIDLKSLPKSFLFSLSYIFGYIENYKDYSYIIKELNKNPPKFNTRVLLQDQYLKHLIGLLLKGKELFKDKNAKLADFKKDISSFLKNVIPREKYKMLIDSNMILDINGVLNTLANDVAPINLEKDTSIMKQWLYEDWDRFINSYRALNKSYPYNIQELIEKTYLIPLVEGNEIDFIWNENFQNALKNVISEINTKLSKIIQGHEQEAEYGIDIDWKNDICPDYYLRNCRKITKKYVFVVEAEDSWGIPAFDDSVLINHSFIVISPTKELGFKNLVESNCPNRSNGCHKITSNKNVYYGIAPAPLWIKERLHGLEEIIRQQSTSTTPVVTSATESPQQSFTTEENVTDEFLDTIDENNESVLFSSSLFEGNGLYLVVYPDDNFYLSYSLAKLCSEISKLKTGKGHITIVSTERDELRNTSLIRGAYASDDVILLEKRNYPDAFLDRLGRTISEMSVSGNHFVIMPKEIYDKLPISVYGKPKKVLIVKDGKDIGILSYAATGFVDDKLITGNSDALFRINRGEEMLLSHPFRIIMTKYPNKIAYTENESEDHLRLKVFAVYHGIYNMNQRPEEVVTEAQINNVRPDVKISNIVVVDAKVYYGFGPAIISKIIEAASNYANLFNSVWIAIKPIHYLLFGRTLKVSLVNSNLGGKVRIVIPIKENKNYVLVDSSEFEDRIARVIL